MPTIDGMYAYITDDAEEGDEGIIGMRGPDGWMPLVGADMERAKELRPYAEAVARGIGKRVTLAHFTKREDLESFG